MFPRYESEGKRLVTVTAKRMQVEDYERDEYSCSSAPKHGTSPRQPEEIAFKQNKLTTTPDARPNFPISAHSVSADQNAMLRKDSNTLPSLIRPAPPEGHAVMHENSASR